MSTLEELGASAEIEAFCGRPSEHRAVLCVGRGEPAATEDLLECVRGEDGAAALAALELLADRSARDPVTTLCAQPDFPHAEAICRMAPLVLDGFGRRAARGHPRNRPENP